MLQRALIRSICIRNVHKKVACTRRPLCAAIAEHNGAALYLHLAVGNASIRVLPFESKVGIKDLFSEVNKLYGIIHDQVRHYGLVSLG